MIPKPLLKKEEKFIKKNYLKKSVLVMAKEMHRGCSTIYRYMDEQGLEPLNKSTASNKHTKDYSHTKKSMWYV